MTKFYPRTRLSVLLHPQLLLVLKCFSAVILCCTLCLLPPVWDAAAMLLAFLLGLSFMHTPRSLFDGLAFSPPTFYASYVAPVRRTKRRRRRRNKWKVHRYWRLRWKRLPLAGRIRYYDSMDDMGIPYDRPMAILRCKFARRNYKSRRRWRLRKKAKRNEKAMADFMTPSYPVTPPWTDNSIPAEVMNDFCQPTTGDDLSNLSKGKDFLHLP